MIFWFYYFFFLFFLNDFSFYLLLFINLSNQGTQYICIFFKRLSVFSGYVVMAPKPPSRFVRSISTYLSVPASCAPVLSILLSLVLLHFYLSLLFHIYVSIYTHTYFALCSTLIFLLVANHCRNCASS